MNMEEMAKVCLGTQNGVVKIDKGPGTCRVFLEGQGTWNIDLGEYIIALHKQALGSSGAQVNRVTQYAMYFAVATCPPPYSAEISVEGSSVSIRIELPFPPHEPITIYWSGSRKVWNEAILSCIRL